MSGEAEVGALRARQRYARFLRAREAVAEGIAFGGGWMWPKLAPLTTHERAVVRRFVADQITYRCSFGLAEAEQRLQNLTREP